jgi:putrescine aminotransferase
MYSIEDAEKLTIQEIHSLYAKHTNPSIVDSIGLFPFGRELVDYAEGCWIYLKNGKKVLDLTGGIGVLNHGHNHPRILAARSRFSSDKKMEVHKSFFSPYIAALSANVSEALSGHLPYSYFPNSGAEAVEGALKLAYKYHGGRRNVVLHADISFHGKLLGAASITGSGENHFKFPSIPGVKSFKFNDADSVRLVIEGNVQPDGESNIFALVVEPLVASSMQMCTEDFLKEVRRLCSEYGIVLIFDEVYTGWGKTGTLFNFMRVENLWPDILTYAKSFGGGKASISGYSHSKELIKAYDSIRDSTLHSSTYYGFGEETATAIEAISVIFDENLVQNSANIGRRFEELLAISPFPQKRVKEIRGSGALWGIELNPNLVESAVNFFQKKLSGKLEIFQDAKLGKKIVMASMINHLYEEHNVLTYFGFNVGNPLIVSFPLVAQSAEVETAFRALTETFSTNLPELTWSFLKLRLN